MRRIKVSSCETLSCVPYKLLSSCNSVEYTEGSPTENAARLCHGEVDAALIPVVDFATEGDFVSLDFGMGCRRRTDSMVLYANQPLKLLKAIHIYECSRSSMFLLKILLKEKWNISPRFIRHSGCEIFSWLNDYEGVLALHPLPGRIRKNLPVVVDISEAWYRHTGLPFVYLVWATRPRVLDAQQYISLNRALHRSAKISRFIARDFSDYYGTFKELSSTFVGDNRRYYLDDFLLRGLNEFSRRAESHGDLPQTPYKRAVLTLLERKVPRNILKRRFADILEDAACCRRICLRDAERLAQEADLEDLVKAAGKALHRGLRIEIMKTIRVPSMIIKGGLPALKKMEAELENCDLARLVFPKKWPLGVCLTVISILTKKRNVKLEAFSTSEILHLAVDAEVPVEKIFEQLKKSGLHSFVLGRGENQKEVETAQEQSLIADDALSAAEKGMGAGLQATVRLQSAAASDWRTRLRCLKRLQTAGDELSAVRGVEILSGDFSIPFDELLRFKLVSEFYLCNACWTFHFELERQFLDRIMMENAA